MNTRTAAPRLRYDFENSLGCWIVSTARLMQRTLNAELAPEGLTHPQWEVLIHVALDPDLCQAELATRMGLEPPTLAGILQRMERNRLVKRLSDPNDARKKRIRILPPAYRAWERIVQCARRVRGEAARGLSAEELDTLRDLLARVRRNLGEEEIKCARLA